MKRKKWAPVIIDGGTTNYAVSDSGDIINITTGREKSRFFSDGYMRVALSVNGKDSTYNIAKLMLESFFNKRKDNDNLLYFYDSDVSNLNLSNIDYISNEQFLHIQTDKVFKEHGDYFVLKDGNYNEDEKWKFIKYKSMSTQFAISNYGRILNVITLNMIKPSSSRSDQYPFVTLMLGNKGSRKSVKFTVHRLVALYFVHNENPEINTLVHHKNDNKQDYSYLNLEWTTPQKNSIYAYESGANPSRGEGNVNAKINESKARKICQMISDGYRVSEITRVLGVSRHIVRHIKDRKCWTYISKDYSFDNSYQYFIDEKLRKTVLQMSKNGLSVKDISKKLGIGTATVYNIRKRMPAGNMCNDSTLTESAIVRMKSLGIDIDSIAELTGFRKRRIKDILNFYK